MCTIKHVLSGHLWERKKEVSYNRWPLLNGFNSFEILYMYDRKGKWWPFNTGGCLIEVTRWTCLTVHVLFTYWEDYTTKPFKDEDWRSVVITRIFLHSFHTHLHKFFGLWFCPYKIETTQFFTTMNQIYFYSNEPNIFLQLWTKYIFTIMNQIYFYNNEPNYFYSNEPKIFFTYQLSILLRVLTVYPVYHLST